MGSKIDRQKLDLLLNNIDIVSLINSYCTLKKVGSNYACLCPFHNEDTPSMVISGQRKRYHCFGCGADGDAIAFIMNYENLDFNSAVARLHTISGLFFKPIDDDYIYADFGLHNHNQIQNIQAAPTDQFTNIQSHSPERETEISKLVPIAEVSSEFNAPLSKLANLFHKNYQQVLAYLQQRNINLTSIQRFKLGYAPPNNQANAFSSIELDLLTQLGLYKNTVETKSQALEASRPNPARKNQPLALFYHRLIFPIWNIDDKLVGFGGRVLTESKKQKCKYLNSPDSAIFKKNQILYGLKQARESIIEKQAVFIVEGYFDVISLAQNGLSNVVAVMGTAINIEQLTYLLNLCPELIFCFDGDTAGYRAARRTVQILLNLAKNTQKFKFLLLPAKHDPDSYIKEYGADKLAQSSQQAPELVEFILQDLQMQLQADPKQALDLNAKQQLIANAIKIIPKLSCNELQQKLQNKLAQITNLDLSALQHKAIISNQSKTQLHTNLINKPLAIGLNNSLQITTLINIILALIHKSLSLPQINNKFTTAFNAYQDKAYCNNPEISAAIKRQDLRQAQAPEIQIIGHLIESISSSTEIDNKTNSWLISNLPEHLHKTYVNMSRQMQDCPFVKLNIKTLTTEQHIINELIANCIKLKYLIWLK